MAQARARMIRCYTLLKGGPMDHLVRKGGEHHEESVSCMTYPRHVMTSKVAVIHLDWLCSSPTTKSYWDYEGLDAVVVGPMISRSHISSQCGG
jgi:hypothetical protein